MRLCAVVAPAAAHSPAAPSPSRRASSCLARRPAQQPRRQNLPTPTPLVKKFVISTRREQVLSRASTMDTDSALLRVYDGSQLSPKELQDLTARPRIDFSNILDQVSPICDAVRERGDEAVKEFTAKFDRVEMQSVVHKIEDLPEPELPEESTKAFDTAFNNIHAFHTAQLTAPMSVETMPGVTCRRISRPIGAVGVYVPGGTAVLPSSALMLAVPAGIAGCKHQITGEGSECIFVRTPDVQSVIQTIVLATPPRPDGSITPEVLYCAKKAGVTHILAAGGAQAVAAMAWGTQSCPKVDKILGPGNQYVTAAKMLLTNSEAMIAIDMPAGPSEVLVVADAGAPPAHVAADLLSQAEHGPDSQVVLVALPGVDLDAVEAEVQRQCDELPRGETARLALTHSYVIKVESKEAALTYSNMYAPEHLILNTEDAEEWLDDIESAGSVFLGRYTPESMGDYASGTNHVLPTYGYARMYSGVSLDSFQKKITVQNLTQEGLMNLGPAVAHMAAVEGLDAHRRAVTLRMGLES